MADDVRDVRVTVDRNAARELDPAKVVDEAQDAVFPIYTDQAQGTAFAVVPTDDGGTWLATNSGGPLLNARGEVVGITSYDLEGGGSGLGVVISMPAFCRAVFQDESC